MNDEQQRLHREVWQAIPWLVNGTLDDDERQRASSHLAACADCRDELELQTAICRGLSADMPAAADANAAAAFARLLERIDADADAGVGRAPMRRSIAERWLPGLVAAVVVQAIGLTALGAFILIRAPAAPAPEYTTLSAPAAPVDGATIRFVPAPELSVGALQALLAEHGLRIVEGNAERPIYALAPTRPIDLEVTLARLRARADVRLAEPIAADAR
ncbi:MAG: zf-HC2 domain-containing protein [Xanthomonadales bacterium]|nr:zf-HC2 domain-containing protein [Xanthomonadales bacterium]